MGSLCTISGAGLKVWGDFFWLVFWVFFLAHVKHHMQQPHAEVFETEIGRSGSQKLCFEAFLQSVLSKKVFLLLIRETLSFLNLTFSTR